jgi:ABC-type antimicrobial peptide transport system permease subunit
MNVLEGVRIAMTALGANITRSVLTTLGVVIGVGAVIAMTALGQGASADVQARISKLGPNTVFITPGKAQTGRIFQGVGTANVLVYDDAKGMRKDVPEIVAVAPEVSTNVQVKVGINNNNYQVIGTYADYLAVHNTDLDAGKWFTRPDEDAGRRVCIIGGNVANDVFGGVDKAMGKTLKAKGVPFTVIAVMSIIGGFGRQDDQIFIPLTTMYQRLTANRYLRLIAISGREDLDVEDVEAAIRRYLRHNHHLRLSQDDDFAMNSQADIAATLSDTTRIFTLLLGGISAISLVVGGIGIMNIMLVTVTERTREIGIRKALGARQRDIRLQFLIESVVLSGLGGLIGVTLGVVTAYVMHAKMGLTTVVTPTSIALSFGCAAFIGIFFGYYPANRAGSLDPIQALRYE